MNLKRAAVFLLISSFLAVPLAGCGSSGIGGGGGLYGDAIMLSDVTQLSKATAGGWSAKSPSVTANVIYATQAMFSKSFTQATDNCLIFQNVTSWDGEKGLTPLTLSSSVQTATATYQGNRYSIAGLSAGAAFSSGIDSFAVKHGTTGALTSVSVYAPPAPADATKVLGTPGGLSTKFHAPDGGFDVFYVFFMITGAGPGESGGMCFIKHDDMTLDGTKRTAPLLSAAMQAAMAKLSMDPSTIYAAYYRQKETDKFFPGKDRKVPIQAGRMFQVSGADLK